MGATESLQCGACKNQSQDGDHDDSGSDSDEHHCVWDVTGVTEFAPCTEVAVDSLNDSEGESDGTSDDGCRNETATPWNAGERSVATAQKVLNAGVTRRVSAARASGEHVVTRQTSMVTRCIHSKVVAKVQVKSDTRDRSSSSSTTAEVVMATPCSTPSCKRRLLESEPCSPISPTKHLPSAGSFRLKETEASSGAADAEECDVPKESCDATSEAVDGTLAVPHHVVPQVLQLPMTSQDDEEETMGTRDLMATLSDAPTASGIELPEVSSTSSVIDEDGSGLEKRIDPADGRVFTFEEFSLFYAGKYKKRDIQKYWDKTCQPSLRKFTAQKWKSKA